MKSASPPCLLQPCALKYKSLTNPKLGSLWPLPGAVSTINETYELHTAAPSFHYRANVLLGLLREQVERYACSGAVYTQTTDVEGEVNGLMTYDRRVVRVDVRGWQKRVRALFEAAAVRGGEMVAN